MAAGRRKADAAGVARVLSLRTVAKIGRGEYEGGDEARGRASRDEGPG